MTDKERIIDGAFGPSIDVTRQGMEDWVSKIQTDARAELIDLLHKAHALLNSHEITFRLPAVPWRDRRDAWNTSYEKLKTP